MGVASLRHSFYSFLRRIHWVLMRTHDSMHKTVGVDLNSTNGPYSFSQNANIHEI